MKTTTLIAVTAAFLLAGCGGEAASSAGSVSTADIGQGLNPGEHELEIVGPVRTVGPYSGDREVVGFMPSNYGQSRERRDGTGGRELVTANNVDGPFAVRMRADLQRGDDEPDRELGAVTLQLPPGAAAGQTYPLENSARARHGEAFLVLMGYGQSLRFDGSGTVSVAELGDHVSLQFEFRGGSAEDDDQRHIIGRAYRVPLTLRGEARYELTINGQREERADQTRFRNDRSLMVAQEITFGFPDPVAQPGSYRVVSGRPGAGEVSLSLHEQPRNVEISGTLDIRRNGEIWSGSFEFEGQGEVSIQGRGSFDHVAAREAHR